MFSKLNFHFSNVGLTDSIEGFSYKVTIDHWFCARLMDNHGSVRSESRSASSSPPTQCERQQRFCIRRMLRKMLRSESVAEASANRPRLSSEHEIHTIAWLYWELTVLIFSEFTESYWFLPSIPIFKNKWLEEKTFKDSRESLQRG